MNLVKTRMSVGYANSLQSFYLKSLKPRVLWPFECWQQLVRGNSCALCILTIASRTKNLSFWLLYSSAECIGLLHLLFLSIFFCLFSFSSSPSPPTHCSMMSAGDLIEQIDCKWNRGVWVNQSNIVKQFFRHEGISLACVELTRAHSPQCWLGF